MTKEYLEECFQAETSSSVYIIVKYVYTMEEDWLPTNVCAFNTKEAAAEFMKENKLNERAYSTSEAYYRIEELPLVSPKHKITTVCYGKKDLWESREEAMNYFFEGMTCTEGSERDRYTNIYIKLQNGLDFCTDEDMMI